MEKPVDKGLTVSKHISRADLKKGSKTYLYNDLFIF
jgi:hypothetical protein